MLPRMILLNPGFTETEAPQEKNHLSEDEGQLAEGEEPLRHCVWRKNKDSSTEHKEGWRAQFKEGSSERKLLKTRRKLYPESLIGAIPISL